MTPKVVLVHPGLRQSGGVTIDVLNLANGVRPHGYRVAVVRSARAAARAMTGPGPRLVHAFSCLPTGSSTFLAMAMARAARVPTIWTPVFHPSRRRSWKGYGPLRVMEAFDALAPYAARLPDVVIAATAAEAEHFARLKAGRVVLVPPGVPGPRPRPPEDELAAFRRSVGLNGGPVVLTVARDNSRKALPFGLRAFERLREQRPDAQLLLVGPDAAHAASRRPGVHCPGWLEPQRVALAYHAADVLFVPSLYEGLPRAVIEAWSAALPVVATERVALAPVIEDVGGLIVEYGQAGQASAALAKLLDDPRLARAYGERGRELVRSQYLLPDCVRRTELLYRELLAS
jgi:glycosyltransferase involved in cell wall biosynthesis